MLCLTGVPHSGDGHLIRPLITRYLRSWSSGETRGVPLGVAGGHDRHAPDSCCGRPAFPALLFAVSLGLITALSKGLSDQPMYDNGIDMHQMAIDARLADFCAFTELQFRTFAKRRDVLGQRRLDLLERADAHRCRFRCPADPRTHSEQKRRDPVV